MKGEWAEEEEEEEEEDGREQKLVMVAYTKYRRQLQKPHVY